MRKTFLIGVLALASCKPADDSSAHKGKEYTKYLKKEVYGHYLACYALNSEAKEQCTSQLAKQYIPRDRQQDIEYIQAFQFEAEKLGFKAFINNQGLDCESVENGPIFTEDKQAYHVICKPAGQYFMRFDYNTKEWNLIKGE